MIPAIRPGVKPLGMVVKTSFAPRSATMLSAKAGMRAKEIAKLSWRMTNDSQGDIAHVIALHDVASKGRSGRRTDVAGLAACVRFQSQSSFSEELPSSQCRCRPHCL
jgi:hypothetical protein